MPESVATLFAFLGLVTPGLVYQLLRERSRPALEETTFREASRIALTSLVFTSLALATLALIAKGRPSWLPDAEKWIRQGTEYAASNLGLVARGLAITVGIATLYALIVHLLFEFVRARSKRKIVKTSVWFQIFDGDVPKGKAPWVLVKLMDGTQYWGWVDFFTVGQAMEDRELSLRGPDLSIKPPGGPSTPGEDYSQLPPLTTVKPEEYWPRVMIRGTDIALVKIKYLPARPNVRWWHRMAFWFVADPSS